MEYFPDKSLEECYRNVEELREQAKAVSFDLLDAGDGELAELLTLMLLSQQNSTMILVHRLNVLEKKINIILSRGNNNTNKRFEI